jgi:glycosyltransferase involved in cell wall biosynthesis/SAM-dependent methyltransferase
VQKLDVVIAVPGLKFNGATFHAQSLGGSESAGYYLARALAKLGHYVTVFSNGDACEADDVTYLPLSGWRQYATAAAHDLCVVQRAPEMFLNPLQGKANVLWCHDLALRRGEGVLKGVSWNVDRVAVLSDFMRRQYQEVYRLPEDFLFQTRNGVDLEAVAQARGLACLGNGGDLPSRMPKHLLFVARPERGLDLLLQEIFPRVLAREPEAVLHLCSYDNTVPQMAEFYARCGQLAVSFDPRVVQEGHLTKQELYRLMHRVQLLVYPTPSPEGPAFREISCIHVMEAMACGLPVVTTGVGALSETLAKGAGTLVGYPSKRYVEEFVDAVISYLRDGQRWQAASARGLRAAQGLGWDAVAEQWTELAEEIIRKKSGDRVSLAYHFYKRSDIVALRALVEQQPEPEYGWLRQKLATDYAFTVEPDGYRLQYEKIGLTHDPKVIDWSPQEARYGILRDWLKAMPEVKTVLDYGCAHGAYATNLLKDLPGLRITGMDIDKHSIAMAVEFAAKLGVRDRFQGVVGDYGELAHDWVALPDPDNAEASQKFDCAVAQEVLEHVPEPWKVLEALEARVKDGGWVYITVPFGPWEFTSYRTYPHRCHVWHFDPHDLREMLKGKKAVRMAPLPGGQSAELGDLLGWWVVRYQVRAAERGFQPIDMARHLWLQAPRESVSACIMAGPGSEETLHWSLRSYSHVADEIVVADCGVGREANRMLREYQEAGLNLKVIPAPDPKDPTVGFEGPRNLALEHCRCAWVLWIDTDERLVGAESLGKYLRPNLFAGYSIRQHHFAVDQQVSPDLPVRIFRGGRGVRWVGMIHEHPERGVNEGVGLSVVIGDVQIAHVGYLGEKVRQGRFIRNAPLLDADVRKYPERLLQKCFIMRDNLTAIEGEMVRGGLQAPTPAMVERLRGVANVYRKHFLGKTYLLATDPLDYYTRALQLLGEGIDVSFQVAAARGGAPQLNGVKTARFADADEAVVELQARARDAMAPYAGQYF